MLQIELWSTSRFATSIESEYKMVLGRFRDETPGLVTLGGGSPFVEISKNVRRRLLCSIVALVGLHPTRIDSSKRDREQWRSYLSGCLTRKSLLEAAPETGAGFRKRRSNIRPTLFFLRRKSYDLPRPSTSAGICIGSER